MKRIIKNLVTRFKKIFQKSELCPVKIRRQEMKKNFRKSNRLINLFLIAVLFLGCFSVNAIAQEKIIKEMVLQVNANIIALPDTEVSKVPIRVARIRSSDLRTLNKNYNAVSIEKLFKTGKKSRLDDIEIKGLKQTGKKEREVVSEVVDVAKVFTKEIKKAQQEKGEKVIELNNVFIIKFEFDEEKNISEIVNAYKELPVVIHAQHIVRTN